MAIVFKDDVAALGGDVALHAIHIDQMRLVNALKMMGREQGLIFFQCSGGQKLLAPTEKELRVIARRFTAHDVLNAHNVHALAGSNDQLSVAVL